MQLLSVTLLFFNTYIDSTFYPKLIFPTFHFLKFNVIQSLSQFYSTSLWHYYFSQGLPILLISYFPLTVYFIFLTLQVRNSGSFSEVMTKQLTRVTLAVIPILSLIAHKEVRFVYPQLPAIHTLMAGVGLPNLSRKWPPKVILVGMIALNIPVALYASMVH